MVVISIARDQVEGGILLEGLAEAMQKLSLHIVFDEFEAVLGTPDDVVLMLEGGVVKVLDSHSPMIPPQW